MIKNLVMLFCTAVMFAACSKENEKETPSGMKYTVLREADGNVAKTGELLVFHYSLKDDKDSTWANTWEEGVPAASQIGDSSQIAQEDGMMQMFRTLSPGDSVTTTMSTADFFRRIVRARIPPGVDTARKVTYTIGAERVTTLEEYLKSREPMVFRRDSKSIDKYVETNKLTTLKDTTGLQYIMHTNTGGTKPKIGDCIEVSYMAKFLRNGRPFDGAESAAFPLTEDLIRGWRIALPLMGKGDSATFYVPSRLAYGQQGSMGTVPPDAILIFDVKLLDVKKNFDPQSRKCK